jgi:copper transport protein
MIATRASRVVVVTLMAWVLATCMTARPALAHAALVASSPSELQILTDPPTEVLLVFDEGVNPALSAITVTGPSKLAVPVGPLSHGTHGVLYLVAPLSGRLPAGDYQVGWRAVSTDDGHPTGGSYSFRTLTAAAARPAGVTPVVGGRASAHPGSAVVFGVARWVAFLGFAALVGALYFLVACWPEGSSRRGWRRLVVGGWAALTAATLTMLLSYGAYAEGAPLGKVADVSLLNAALASHVGGVLLLRLGLLVAGAALAVVLVRRMPLAWGWAGGRASRLVVLAAGAGLALTWSAISHSSAQATPMVAVDVVHLVSTAVWLGGLAALGVVVLGKKEDPAVAGRVVATFSSTALVCVVVLVATGCVQAWQRVGSVAALTDNSYARLLLGKLALVGLTLLLAGVARFRLLRRQLPKARLTQPPALARLRRLVLAEVGLGVAVLTVTSLLVSTEPAAAAHAQLVAARRNVGSLSRAGTRVTAASVVIPPLSGKVPYDAGIGTSGRGEVTLSVQPPQVGATSIHLSVLDASGTPRPIAELIAAMRRPAFPHNKPIPMTFVKISPGHYVSRGASFVAAGSWQLGIALRLPGGAGAIAIAGITVR